MVGLTEITVYSSEILCYLTQHSILLITLNEEFLKIVLLFAILNFSFIPAYVKTITIKTGFGKRRNEKRYESRKRIDELNVYEVL